MKRFANADVAAAFKAYPAAVRRRLMELRELVFETAAGTEGVGPLSEALKWGQPSFLTKETGSGTTVRIDAVKGSHDRYALYVNCKTTLLDSYRLLYPDGFAFEGFRNADGTVGTRNILAITTTVQCVSGVVEHAGVGGQQRIRDEAVAEQPGARLAAEGS